MHVENVSIAERVVLGVYGSGVKIFGVLFFCALSRREMSSWQLSIIVSKERHSFL